MRQRVVRLAGLREAMVCAGLVAATAGAVCAGPDVAAPVPLRVALTTSLALPDAVRDALQQEVSAIWRREGIAIDWSRRAPLGDTPVDLRVLVVSSGRSAPAGEHRWPVAELLHDAHGRPLAVASVAGARRVLDSAGAAGDPAMLSARRLGVVLGRAVAHEIGHHLLNTTGHARHGLMRARIAAHDFADLREGGFGLDDDASLWARTALSRESADALRLARFVYAR